MFNNPTNKNSVFTYEQDGKNLLVTEVGLNDIVHLGIRGEYSDENKGIKSVSFTKNEFAEFIGRCMAMYEGME